jgi:hypothetical protein
VGSDQDLGLFVETPRKAKAPVRAPQLMLMSPFDLRRTSRVSNLTVQFAQDDLLTQHRKARTSITSSNLSDPYNAPLHFHPQSLCNGDPEADMCAFLRTGARKHKDPEFAKVITASFPLFVNTVGICPPEDDRHVQRKTLRFAAYKRTLSRVLNNGFCVCKSVQMRYPNFAVNLRTVLRGRKMRNVI